MGFDELLRSKKVLICCGSGGVGKTTLSASLGVKAAEMGLKVLVLTIDPARRLMTALGLHDVKDGETQVAPGQFKGELYASMLESKRVFDDFIVQLAPSPETAQRVLNNRIYQQISTALSGSQEWTALEKLYQAVSSGKYDLVILDTPPTQHAIDFLNAPTKIYTLFQDSIIKWFMMPFNTLDRMSLGLMNRGTKAALKAFERIGGAEFLSTLTDFFTSIRDWQKVLQQRTAEVHRLLTSDSSGFILVTGFNAVRIDEARFFEGSLKKGGYTLSAIIVNRAFPLWDTTKESVPQASGPALQTPAYRKLIAYYDELHNFYRTQEEAFRGYANEIRHNVIFCRIPDFDQDVHDVESLKRVASRLTAPSSQGETRE